MKKIRVLAMVLLSAVLFSTSFLGCKHDPTTPVTPDNPVNPDTPVTPDDPANQGSEDTPATSSTLQSQIDSAAAGGTVTLTASSVVAGASISITKALTVNGNNLEGLTVNVSSEVASGVTLKNFKNATIKVGTVSSNRSARSARAADEPAPVVAPVDDPADQGEAEPFKKLGDDVFPLYLEGCTIDKLEAEDDLVLHLGIEDKKTVIDELCLKEGVEEFTFVEFDKADKPETTADEKTEKEDKTLVKKLSIEDDGIKEINLIGGTFSDVDYAADFAGTVDFKFDKEFAEDQFDFGTEAADLEKKEAFMDKFEPVDIGVAEFDPSLSVNTVTTYAFSIPKDVYQNLDGRISVAFFTDVQKEGLEERGHGAIWCAADPNAVSIATYDNPIYIALPSGGFRIDTKGNSSSAYKTIYGSEGAYIDYAHAIAKGLLSNYEKDDVVVLDNYQNYNKEAFIAEVGESDVTIYVNMAAIRKNDVLLCAAAGPDGQYGEAGTKITEVNLNGYKPYLMIDWGKYETAYFQVHGFSPNPSEYITIAITDENRSLYFDNDNNMIPDTEYAQQYNAWLEELDTWNSGLENPRQFALNAAIKMTNTNNEQQIVDTFIPYGASVKLSFEFHGTFTPMLQMPYPDVSNVSYSVIPVSDADKQFAQMILQQFDEEEEPAEQPAPTPTPDGGNDGE